MQQSELRERIEGRQLDYDAAVEISELPYKQFFSLYIGRKYTESPTMHHAIILRLIALHYENKALKEQR